MNHGEYCTTVCKGKCCKVFDENQKEIWRCPNQLDSGACAIYDEWKDTGTCGIYFPEIENILVNINQAIERKLLDPRIEAQCCYAHPELLEKV